MLPADWLGGAGGEVKFTYSNTIRGAAIRIPEPALNGLRQNPRVAYIEVDQEMKAFPPPPGRGPEEGAVVKTVLLKDKRLLGVLLV